MNNSHTISAKDLIYISDRTLPTQKHEPQETWILKTDIFERIEIQVSNSEGQHTNI